MVFTLFSLPGAMLCGTFLVAGVIDAVCGGGGLLTLPMFMAAGFPVHFITGTNQCSIVVGSATALTRFARRGCIHWPTAAATVPFAMLGATLGARLNMMLPERSLELVMTLLVPIAATLVLVKRSFGDENHIDQVSLTRRGVYALLIGLGIGLYQGFYGAGSGAFYMLAFAILMRLDLTTASGNTKLVSFCSVLTASVTYALSGLVYWPMVLAATVFNVIGNYIGAGLAMKRGARFIRPMFLAVLGLLFLRLALGWIIP